jgi:protein required for attachment to host cells
MDLNNIPTGTWILVADGTGARLFCNKGNDNKLALKQEALLQPEELIDAGPAGHRPPESSDQATDEATFAKQLAHRLNAAALKQEFSHLVLMADPQTLGQLRPLLHLETRQRIITEIGKTFTNAPLEDIEAALS